MPCGHARCWRSTNLYKAFSCLACCCQMFRLQPYYCLMHLDCCQLHPNCCRLHWFAGYVHAPSIQVAKSGSNCALKQACMLSCEHGHRGCRSCILTTSLPPSQEAKLSTLTGQVVHSHRPGRPLSQPRSSTLTGPNCPLLRARLSTFTAGQAAAASAAAANRAARTAALEAAQQTGIPRAAPPMDSAAPHHVATERGRGGVALADGVLQGREGLVPQAAPGAGVRACIQLTCQPTRKSEPPTRHQYNIRIQARRLNASAL